LTGNVNGKLNGVNVTPSCQQRMQDGVWNLLGQLMKLFPAIYLWIHTENRQLYLTASTYLSSRAFPSSILSPTPSLLFSPSTNPILLPGIDSLNHARGQRISWVVACSKENGITAGLPCRPEKLKQPTVSLVLHTPSIPGQELFNNYGKKPNSELILGYGFSIPQNPDDTIVLKIGGTEGKKWEVGRKAWGADGVWQEILALVAQDPESESSYDDHLEAAGVLADMIQTLLDRLPPTKGEYDRVEMRPEVALMLHDYIEGEYFGCRYCGQ